MAFKRSPFQRVRAGGQVGFGQRGLDLAGNKEPRIDQHLFRRRAGGGKRDQRDALVPLKEKRRRLPGKRAPGPRGIERLKEHQRVGPYRSNRGFGLGGGPLIDRKVIFLRRKADILGHEYGHQHGNGP